MPNAPSSMDSRSRPPHPVERGSVRGHVLPAEGVDAQGGVADQEREVDGHPTVEAAEVGVGGRPVELDPVGQAVEAGIEACEGEQVGP